MLRCLAVAAAMAATGLPPVPLQAAEPARGKATLTFVTGYKDRPVQPGAPGLNYKFFQDRCDSTPFGVDMRDWQPTQDRTIRSGKVFVTGYLTFETRRYEVWREVVKTRYCWGAAGWTAEAGRTYRVEMIPYEDHCEMIVQDAATSQPPADLRIFRTGEDGCQITIAPKPKPKRKPSPFG